MKEDKIRKAINFDLDDHLLKANYPEKSYKNAYKKIKITLDKFGFDHRQYSGYISRVPLDSKEMYVAVSELVNEHPWIYNVQKKLILLM